MLNNPGEDTTASPADETTRQSVSGSHVTQIAVIAMVGIYLFGVVWLYAHLPWLAIGVTGIAVLMIIAGFIRQLRKRVSPPGAQAQ